MQKGLKSEYGTNFLDFNSISDRDCQHNNRSNTQRNYGVEDRTSSFSNLSRSDKRNFNMRSADKRRKLRELANLKLKEKMKVVKGDWEAY